MRIVCPACETGYQMADGTLGATGRKVRCARCGTVWHARPDDYPEAPVPRPAPPLDTGPEPSEDEWRDAITGDGPKSSFDDVADEEEAGNDQSAIDDLFADAKAEPEPEADDEPEEAPVTAPAPEPAEASAEADIEAEAGPTVEAVPQGFSGSRRKPRKTNRGATAFGKLDKHLSTPVASTLLIGFLVAFLTLAVVGRERIVSVFPDYAGLYELVGLKVNLRRLEFSEVAAHREMDGSTPVLVVEGDITNLDSVSKSLPAVRVTLISSTGRDVYAWNHTLPQLNIDQAGKIHFKTRLLAPPEAATTAEVRFTDLHQP